MSNVISMKQLLEAGVHFGHQTRRWNPKMAEYIFTQRNGIHIVDLQKTVKKIEEAYDFVRDLSANGGTVLFVGTKKQAQDSIKEEAERVGMYYVNARWLGGMITNFTTIRRRVDRLANLRKMQEDGTFDLLPKKEVIKLNLEIEKLEKFLGGIKDMKKLPSALFIVDPRKEHIALAEAKKLGIPVIAIVDTNCDPDVVDYVIPGNDDAIRAVKLISEIIGNAVLEGRQGTSMAEATAEASVAQGEAKETIPFVMAEEDKVKVETPKAAPKAAKTDKPLMAAIIGDETTLVAKEAKKPAVRATKKVEEPKAEEVKAEEPKAEEPAKKPVRRTTKKAEEPKAEEPKAEEPAKKPARRATKKAEEPKAE